MQEEAAAKAVGDGWILPAFDTPFAEVTFSPQFVLRRAGSSPRLIDDHAASGLNDGITDVPCIYDRVSELIHLLRFLGLLDDSLPSHAMLFKLNVSAAFKILLMHPLWQLRQGIAVAYRSKRGKPRIRYHLQWRAAFGSKASPYLWTSLMSAVHWVILQRVPEVPHPFSYLDDTYSVATSGRYLLLRRHGEIRRIPIEQAGILAVWDEWGLPWKWAKTEWGRFLVITGLLIDLDEATIRLPPSAVAVFAAEAEDFLACPTRSHPLRRWRQICGYANWALTVIPFARPLLTPLFTKLRLSNGAPRNQSPYTPVFINNDVRLALQAFVTELRDGPPLDLCDLSLSHWTKDDADLIVYTDACLEDDGGSGSGLGFWYELGACRHHFFCRPKVRWVSIQFAELLAVLCAVEQALLVADSPLFPHRLRRLLIRSDSAPAVYAFHSGAAKDTEAAPLRLIVSEAFTMLRAAHVDLHVRHISGKNNLTADVLSRARVRDLFATYGTSLKRFSPPPAVDGRALTQ